MLLHKRQIVLILAWLVLISTQAIAIYQGEPYISSCFPIPRLAIALTFWLELIAIIITGIAFIFTATKQDVTEHPHPEDKLCSHQQELSTLPKVTDDITAFKQTQAALQSNQNLIHTVLENIPNGGVFLFDQNLRFILAAGLGLEVVGITKADMEGKTIWEALPPETYSQVELPYRQAFAGIISRFEAPYGHRVYEVHVLPVRNDDGEIFAGMTITQEITERKQVEAELRRKQERLDLAHLAAKIGSFEWNIPIDVNIWSKEIEALYGLEPGEFGGTYQDWVKLVHPEDLAQVEASVTSSLETGEIFTDWRVIWPDGSVHWLHARGKVFYDQDGKPLRMVGINVDITEQQAALREQKSAQAALQESEERLRLTLKASKQGLYDLDFKTGNAVVSPEYAQMLGYEPQEFQESNQAWSERLHPDDRDLVYPVFDQYVAGNIKEYWVEFRQRTKSGDWRWILSLGKIVAWDEEGKPLRMLGTHTDITQRKESEVALQNALQLLNLHIDTTPLAVVQWDCHLCVTRWSSAAEKIFGWLAEEVIGKYIQDLHIVYEEDITAVAEVSDRLLSGQEAQIIQYNRNYTKDGRVIHCEWYNSSIANEEGSVTSVLSLVLDVTERIQAEKALRQSELMVIEERAQALERERAARMELERASRMKDEFLAIVSHELRSPLNGILGWSRLLRTRKLSPEKIEQALESIERNAQAQTQLIEDLLDISRIIRGNIRLLVRPTKLIPVIQAALDTVRPIANTKSIQIISRLNFDIGLVSADPERLQQVIWNLLSNAVKFTPEGGRVEICLEPVETNVQIQVTDTGKGISPEFLPYVFDRFRQADATTTRNQGGLGLGLAIVRNLVELHNGTVSVASPGEGQGATFTVQLPILPTYSTLTPEEPLIQRQTAWDTKVQIKGLKILAVDDEPDTREFLKTALEQYGAIVTTAASTREALKLLQLVKPDVLLSDIGMPNEDGYALIRQIRALSSEQGGNVPAAALTAYTRQSDRLQALTAGFQIHISKPIEPIQLLKIVATLAGNNSN